MKRITIGKIKNEAGMLTNLVKNDLKSRYSGNALGSVWAYIQPLVTILVFWYVFQVGFRNPPVNNVQFILWFIAGYIPWIFFNDGVLATANVFYEYSYLVKKMKFKIWQLPIVKVLSSLCIHSFFWAFIIGMYFLYGYKPRISWISMFYYSFCVVVLLIGMSYLVSSLSVFIKDNSQVVNILLQLGFWMTPIFWSEDSMNAGVLKVLKLNPLFYVITGYRSCLIDGLAFWERPILSTGYFWVSSIVILLIGVGVYKRLNGHFADLL